MENVKLKTIAKQVRGVSYKPDDLAKERMDGFVPLLRTGNIGASTISNLDDLVFVSEKNVAKQQYLLPGDILIAASSGSIEIVGKSVYIEDSHGFTFGAFCKVIRPTKELVNPKYVSYYFQTDYYRKMISNLAQGANINNLRNEHIDDLELPLPDLETQNKIVAILDKAKAILDKREETIKKYDELLRATFLEIFGDPVKNEKGWEIELLGTICDVGSSKRVFVEELKKEGIPFYRGTEIGQLAEYVDISPTLFIKEEHYEILKKHSGIPKIGDLLMPSICPDGRIWRVTDEDPFYFKDGRVLWIKVSKIGSIYLQFALKAIFATNYSNIASGTTFAELKIVALKGIKIPIPPLNLQEKFATIIEKIETIRTKTKNVKRLKENVYSGLSQQAFKGELDFNTAVHLELLLENDYEFFQKNSNSKSIQLLLERLNTDELNDNKFYEQQTYNKAKSFVFELIKEGKVKQLFDGKTKKVKLTV